MRVEVTMGEVPKKVTHEPGEVWKLIAYTVMTDVTNYVANRLALNTPSGATGMLARSVTPSVERNLAGNWEGHIDYAEPAGFYAGFAEDGTRPHWPPYAPIELWAIRVLGTSDPKVVGGIRRSIAMHGTKPQKFVQKTVDSLGSEVGMVADMAVGKAIAKL
jgi:hypothetical protein